SYGLFGIWGAISITSVFKGTLLPLWFWFVLRNGGNTLKPSISSRWIVLLPSRLRQHMVITKD
ncbi:MAG: hypothetical protein LC643_09320, partial [Bacteroidales bacterium]|nr:hypothetical protein [Bacteroidales bacterium]